MSEFDWQTEETDDWEENEAGLSAENRPRRWRLWLAIFISLLLAGGIIAWEAQRRIQLVTTEIESEIIDSFELLTATVNTQDRELFTTLLSGRDQQWSNTQLQFWRSGSLFQRQSLNAIIAGEPTVAAIELSPDLTSAELTVHTPYRTTQGAVSLAQTVTFRQGSTHWLYAPPDEAFWGEMQIMTSDSLIIIYPERDEQLVRQLFDDLSRLVGTPSAQFGNFQPDQPLQIELTTDPQSLLRRPRHGLNFVELPSPTLFGLPIDEAGYGVLLDLYSHNIFAPIQAHLQPTQKCLNRPCLFTAIPSSAHFGRQHSINLV